MRIETWEAEMQRTRMRRAYWFAVLFGILYAAVAIPAASGLH